jgi:uncharacterized membrane protein
MKRRFRRGKPTETGRSEGFSDGVFAVAITLLALDLGHIHATERSTLFDSIARHWPVLLAFAASFAFIGVAWMNHHNVFARIKGLSRSLNAANLLLLAGIIVIPWATSTLAEALSLPGKHGQQEVLLYSTVLIYEAFAWFLLFNVLVRNPDLLEDPADARGFAADRFSSFVGMGTGVVAGLIGFFWSPVAATVLFLAMPIFFAVVSEGFERAEDTNP